jgi:diacylglycerol kinase (ATP)
MVVVLLALVANPKSGAGRSPEEIAGILREHRHEVTTFPLDRAEEAAASGADRVVVAGGDGSIGTVFAACAAADVPLAVLPAGTANDFARAIGVPADLDDAVAVAVDPDARQRQTWGGRIDGRPFVNVASIGLSVDAAREAAPLKSLLGPVAYAAGALLAAVRGRPVLARVAVDGVERFAGDAWQVLVASSGAFGGIAQLPDSDPRTAELEAYVLPAGSRRALVRRVWSMRPGGDRTGLRTLVGRRIEVTAPAGCRWNVDGEIVRLDHGVVEPLGPVTILIPHDPDGSATDVQ